MVGMRAKKNTEITEDLKIAEGRRGLGGVRVGGTFWWETEPLGPRGAEKS